MVLVDDHAVRIPQEKLKSPHYYDDSQDNASISKDDFSTELSW
jgi:hypothetical protein